LLTTAKEALLQDKQSKPQLLVMKVGGLQQVGNLLPRKNKKIVCHIHRNCWTDIVIMDRV